ncbi:Pycsar system effector family protein [Vreelandella jeotgali]|uniref:Pycsar system effector family protein n=1 Tax=Vreelandella jeotgali TaxID=553386 RepID=UPI0035302741
MVEKKSLILFGDVASYENGSSGYAAKIKDASLDILIEDLSKQAFVVAEVAKEKFRILKIAVIIIVWGVIPSLSISIIFLMLEGVD